jgi:D-glycero-D-manno-heptose 1,7-bisphosphate phosphatase
MLLQAARDHAIDLERSYMVGDKLADIEAGRAAGCRSLLVRTGYGRREEPLVAMRFPGTEVFASLSGAVDYIVDRCLNKPVDF